MTACLRFVRYHSLLIQQRAKQAVREIHVNNTLLMFKQFERKNIKGQTGVLSKVVNIEKAQVDGAKDIKTKPKKKSVKRKAGEPNHLISNTKKAKAIKKVAEKHQKKKNINNIKNIPTLISPSKGINHLRQAKLTHPVTATESSLRQQFRGYLQVDNNSLWNISSLPPSEMTPDNVWALHDLDKELEFENEVFYISDDTVVIDEPESNDSSIIELAVRHEDSNVLSHVSDSEFDSNDILVTETRNIGATNNVKYIETIDSDADDIISALSDIDDEGFVSDNQVPETPLPSNDLLDPFELSDADDAAPVIEEEKNPLQQEYNKMKIAELRAIAKEKGLGTARSKQAIIDMLINNNIDFDEQLTLKLKDNISTQWYTKIITYHPINIDQFYKFVKNELKLNITQDQLRKYCDSKGVCFSSNDEWGGKKN